MASDMQSVLAALQQTNYGTVVVVTAIVYDYLLTFSKEVEYVWSKPWTFVSTAFVLVRYLSLYSFITLWFVGTSFLPGPAKYTPWYIPCPLSPETFFQGLVFQIIGTWTIFLFICAADLVMILRVWAMYHRSKFILGILLTSYTVEIVPSTIGCIIYSNPRLIPITVTRITNFSFCTLGFIPLGWNKASSITQLIHATVMCVLVLVRFVWQSIRMYKATKQWQLNQFINLFVMEGVLYFLFMLGWNIINTLYGWGNFSPAGWQIIFTGFIESVPIATTAPRFVLSVRELYARNVPHGYGSGIDSGFGLSARDTSMTTIVFVDGGQDEGLEHGEEVTTDERSV